MRESLDSSRRSRPSLQRQLFLFRVFDGHENDPLTQDTRVVGDGELGVAKEHTSGADSEPMLG